MDEREDNRPRKLTPREQEILAIIRASAGYYASNLRKRWKETNATDEQRLDAMLLVLAGGLIAVAQSATMFTDNEIITVCLDICRTMNVRAGEDEIRRVIADSRKQAMMRPDFTGEAVKETIRIQKSRPSRAMRNFEKYADNHNRQISSWRESDYFGFGIDLLDEAYRYVKPGQICVISGAQGGMKTSFALRGVMNALEKGNSLLFFSLDMEGGDLMERIIRSRIGIDKDMYAALVKAGDDWDIDQEKDAFAEQYGELFELFDNQAVKNIDGLLRTVDQRRPKIVVIDYLTRLKRFFKGIPGSKFPRGYRQSDLECAEEVMPMLKDYAQTHGTIFIVLSQMSRASKKDAAAGLIGGHAKGGGVIEELAHVEIERGSDVDANGGRRIIAEITKARDGEQGAAFMLDVDFPTQTILGSATRVWREKHEKARYTRNNPFGASSGSADSEEQDSEPNTNYRQSNTNYRQSNTNYRQRRDID